MSIYYGTVTIQLRNKQELSLATLNVQVQQYLAWYSEEEETSKLPVNTLYAPV